MTSKTYLAQGTVGLFIKELDLIGSRTGLFVREAPGNLKRRIEYSSFVFRSGLCNYQERLNDERLET